MNPATTFPHPPEPPHQTEREGMSYLKLGVVLHPLLSTLLLMVALFQLGVVSADFIGIVKLILIATAAYLTAYLVYRLVIEKTAPLAAEGFHIALIVGVAALGLVGGSFFMSTAPGLSVAGAEHEQLQAYNDRSIAYADIKSSNAAQASRFVPVISSITEDIAGKVECEIDSSCVSGRGSGGYGPTARALENLHARAESVRVQVEDGLEQQILIREQLQTHLGKITAALEDESQSIWDRRNELRSLDGQLGQILNNLEEAIPTALMQGYREELDRGIRLPSSPNAEEAINASLLGYASAIDAVLESFDRQDAQRPTMPERVGALDSFSHAGKYAPIVLLAFLIDVVFPMLLWVLAYLNAKINLKHRRFYETKPEIDTIIGVGKRPGEAQDHRPQGTVFCPHSGQPCGHPGRGDGS